MGNRQTTEVKQETEVMQHLFDAFKANSSTDALHVIELIKNGTLTFNKDATFKGWLPCNRHHEYSTHSRHYYDQSLRYRYISCLTDILKSMGIKIDKYVCIHFNFEQHELNIDTMKPVWLAYMFSGFDVCIAGNQWTKVFEELVELSNCKINDLIFGYPAYYIMCYRDGVSGFFPFLNSYKKIFENSSGLNQCFYNAFLMACKSPYNKMLDIMPIDAIIDHVDVEGNTILHTVCKYSDGSEQSVCNIRKILETATKKNIKLINSKNSNGDTPVHTVCNVESRQYSTDYTKKVPLLKLLVDSGADLTIKNSQNKTVRQDTFDKKYYEMFKIIDSTIKNTTSVCS